MTAPQLAPYDVEVWNGRATRARALRDGFEVRLADGTRATSSAQVMLCTNGARVSRRLCDIVGRYGVAVRVPRIARLDGRRPSSASSSRAASRCPADQPRAVVVAAASGAQAAFAINKELREDESRSAERPPPHAIDDNVRDDGHAIDDNVHRARRPSYKPATSSSHAGDRRDGSSATDCGAFARPRAVSAHVVAAWNGIRTLRRMTKEASMRKALCVGSVLMLVAMSAGCGGEKKTVIHRETVQTVPAAPVVQERRTVETRTTE